MTFEKEAQQLWLRLVDADKRLCYIDVVQTLHSLQRLDPSLTFDRLEVLLRKHGMNTFLIANRIDATVSAMPNVVCMSATQQIMPYMLHVTVGRESDAAKYLLLESQSCEENLRKLSETGVLTQL